MEDTSGAAATTTTAISQESVEDNYFYVKMFFQESLEIFILYMIYALLTENSKFEVFKALKISLILASLSIMLEVYNPVLKGHMKSGLFSGVGSGLMKN